MTAHADRDRSEQSANSIVRSYGQTIYDIAVDHPMWIGDDSQPLDYNPDREARIGDFVEESARAVMAVADAEQAELQAEVERLRRELSHSFWSPREWEDWSNDLASMLPEEAEEWPGVNPEGAQESIITASLCHLVSALARIEALCARLEANGGVASPKAIRNTLADRPTYAALAGPEPDTTEDGA